jgi:hypothetical protein
MMPPRRKPHIKRFQLNDKMSSIVSASPDPIVRDLLKVLEAFEYAEAIGSRFVWKYLPDDAFNEICNKPDMNVRMLNRTPFSHLVRIIEAFEMVSIWRSRDLVGSCVVSLNEKRLISAATLARSLIELTVTYGDAANFLQAAFRAFLWSELGNALIQPMVTDENGKEINLEIFIERLMSGTRMSQQLDKAPHMSQRNIMTVLQKLDKKLLKEHGYQIKPHYDFLCELAHPNTIGFQRYISSVAIQDNKWENRVMEEESESLMSFRISHECLWALSFGTGSMSGVFGVFQELKQNVLKNIGRPLPQ